MLYVVCGLIGAGKTTYAQQNYQYYTDLDDMHPISSKEDQIDLTLSLLRSHDEVCHITCFPTPKELEAFRGTEMTLIWINTSLKQAQANIVKRGRPRDLANLPAVLTANTKYSATKKRSTLNFELINVFEEE